MSEAIRDPKYREFVWFVLQRRDGMNCFWCSRRVVRRMGVSKPDTATLDHIVPKSEGGKDKPDNLVIACHACNTTRMSTPAEEFLRKKLNERRSASAA